MSAKVSICVPTYNRASTLSHTIMAILRQTFSDWELIVSDDASGDNTEDVVRSFSDRRIHYYRNETNLGLYPNWNRCIELASGDYVAIYHDHDLYFPTIVERCATILDKYPMVSFVHTALLTIDAANRPLAVDIRQFREVIKGEAIARLLADSWASPIMAATAMVRREAYHQVGFYDPESYSLGCDLDMWFRLSQIGDVAYINEPQALILARLKEDDTAVFRWQTVTGAVAMRRDHIGQVFKADRLPLKLNQQKFVYQKNWLLLTYMIRAILLEPLPVINQGVIVMRQEAMHGSLWLIELIKNSPTLQDMLRELVLPVHHKRVARFLAARRVEAEKYVAAHQSVREFLQLRDIVQV